MVTTSHSTVSNRVVKRLHLSPTKRDLMLSGGVVNRLRGKVAQSNSTLALC